MANRTSTYENVHLTADILLKEGVKPTQQNVRERLGSGSISTINKALNDWWKAIGKRLDEQHQRPELPEPVISTAVKIWQQALEHSQKEVETQYLQAKVNLEREWDLVKKAREQSEFQGKDATERLDKEIVRRETSDARAQALQHQLFETEKRVITLSSENTALTRELQQQDLLSNQSPVAPPDELIELKVQNRIREKELLIAKQQAELLAEQNSLLETQLKRQEKASQDKVHALETVIAQQDVRFQSLKEEYERYRYAQTH